MIVTHYLLRDFGAYRGSHEKRRELINIRSNAPDCIVLIGPSGCIPFRWRSFPRRIFGFSSKVRLPMTDIAGLRRRAADG